MNTTGSESNSEGAPNNGGDAPNNGGGATSLNGSQSTGLPWPKTWKGAYFVVIANFALWVVMLLALQEFCK